MAQYNADIRIGVTGKAQLNQLEAQLKRTQTQLNKLNKSLQLRTRVQAIRLDTRAANTAIKQLEQRINRLGRTINVNLRVNEREGRKSQSNNGSVFVNNQGTPAAIAAATTAQRQYSKAVTESTKAVQEAFKPSEKLFDLQQKQTDLQDKVSTQLEKQAAAQKRVNQANAGLADKGKSVKRSQADARRSLIATTNYLNKYQKELREAQQEAKRLEDTERRAAKFRADEAARAQREAFNRQRRQNLQFADTGPRVVGGLTFDERLKKVQDQQKKAKGVGRGFAAGGGVALATVSSSIPVLNEAISGGLVAGLSGASVAAGALGGALVGLGAAAVAVTADTTKFNNELGLMRRALANTVSNSDELKTALAGIRGVSEDFLVPIGDATEQFTKLNAAARASGFTVEEVEEVYRGLAAANVALGGDSQKLQGILLATQQVFSKGKVQAEELRGQIGERLAGAFAKFAESAGLSTSELDKALEKGEVSLEDFVRFAQSLLEEYEEDAKKLKDAPENAGTRLKIAMDNLREAMGPITQDIGNMFTNMAVTAVNAMTDIARRAAKLPLDIARAQRDAAVDAFRRAEKGDWNYDRVRSTMERAVKNFNDRKAAYDALGGGGLTPTGKPPGNRNQNQNTNTNTGGSTSGPRDTTAELTAAIALQKELLRIEQQRSDLTGLMGDLREIDLQQQEASAALQEQLAVNQTKNITEASKLLANELAQLQYKTDLAALDNQRLNIIRQFTQESVDGAKQLVQETNLLIAADARREELLRAGVNPALAEELVRIEQVFDQKRELLDLDIARLENALLLADAESEIAKAIQEQIDKLKELRGELDKAEGKQKDKAKKDNPGKIESYLNQLQDELADTEGMIVSLAQTIQGELSNAMSRAVTGLIDGTTTVEEVLADMFENIGKAFINMAAEIISKQLVMIALQSILKALGGAAGGGASAVPSSAYGDFSIAGPDFFSGGMIPGYSGGGYTGDGPRSGGVDGKGGFLTVMHPQETVVDNAMLKYSPGNNAGAAGAAGAEGDAGGITAGPMNFSFSTVRIADEEYVDRDQLQAAMAAAAKSGAKQGEAMTLRRLQMSPGTRRRTGI